MAGGYDGEAPLIQQTRRVRAFQVKPCLTSKQGHIQGQIKHIFYRKSPYFAGARSTTCGM